MGIKRILVVDDAATDRAFLHDIVSDAGFLVSIACSGREALEKASHERPDLVFLDLLMNDMDGFQTCRQLRAQDSTRDVPVVIVSSKNQKADRMWALEQGASAYVSKPYRDTDILDVIRKFQ